MPKLNRDNYHTWCIRSRAVLVQKRCWEAVEPGYGIQMNEAQRKMNDEALTLLFLIVEDTFLHDIGDCIRARDAWTCLKEMHTKFGLLHVLQLMREFFNINMKPNESVQSYLARLMDLRGKLANGGYAFTDRKVALVMLLGLPRSYESLILSLEKDEANLTTTIVKPRLLVEEKRIIRNESSAKVYHEEQALHTKGFATNQKKPAFGKPMKNYAAKRPNEEETNRGRSTTCFSCELGGNLLSIGRIEERGLKVEFPEGKAKVIGKNGDTLLSGEKKGRLYIIKEKMATAYATKTESANLLHHRLGHPHFCTTKNIGKMKRKKFLKAASTKAKDILEVTHSDVVGKISPPSFGSSNYFVTFTDEFPHYTTAFPMKAKIEVLEKFEEYCCMVENLQNRKTKFLRSNNGGEYISGKFDKYLTAHGIQRQLTVPDTPQQNGLAERLNQTLINTTRCLLIESGADHRFWVEAMATAAYLHNKRTSMAIDGDIPEGRWSGYGSKADHLRVFGFRAWSHVRSHSRGCKLDPKATECVSVGYPKGVKGYKFKCANSAEEATLKIEDFESEYPLDLPETEACDSSLDHIIPEANDLDESEHLNTDPIDQNFERYPDIQLGNTPDYEDEGQSVTEIQDVANNLDSEVEAAARNPAHGSERGEKRKTKIPKHFEDFYLYNAQEVQQSEGKDPVTLKDVLKSPKADMWLKAMEEEIQNLTQAQTWELTTKPQGAKVIPSRWLLHKKKDEIGNRAKFKERLVTKGYLQIPGVDFQDTFSPVIKLKSIRLLLAVAAEKNLEVHQMDVTAAYLNVILKEDIYMAQLEGCIEKGKEHLVCHLKKSIYGLRQSGRAWNTCLNDFLIQYGLKRSSAKPCIYFCHEKNIIIGIYVDDLLIVGNMAEINEFKGSIKKRFSVKDLGPASQILSMQICKEENGSFTLDQIVYILEILETFKMTEAKCASTPLDFSIKYKKVDEQQWEEIKENSKEIPYRQAIGSLLYMSCGTHPDMAYSSTYMSQFNEKYDEEHWRGVKHILRYLKGTQHRKLRFQKTGEPLQVYSDADWGGDRTDHTSYSGTQVLQSHGRARSNPQQLHRRQTQKSDELLRLHTLKKNAGKRDSTIGYNIEAYSPVVTSNVSKANK
ncbi:Retrovirus-related Pol polyprotein from transposon TNT 1-94, partial [Stegodyphus mimosarum]